jgi:hypothetical protein
MTILGDGNGARPHLRLTHVAKAGALAVAVLIWPAARGAAAAENGPYTLFNPTPDRLLRELATDRPDATESPFTVDAGHVQFETTIFGYTRSRPDAGGTVTDSYELGTTNVRIGLTGTSEFNVIWQPYGIVRTHTADPQDATRNAGVGGLTLRGKVNLWGNDTFEKGGATALGLLPYLSLPTDRGNGISPDAVEGGFILPFAVKLSDTFDLGLNAGIAAVRNDDMAGYHAEYFTSASLSHDWNERLSTYCEVTGRFGTRNPLGDVAVVATGVAYKLDKNLQIDAGINIGVTRAADRFNPFIGISRRF